MSLAAEQTAKAYLIWRKPYHFVKGRRENALQAKPYKIIFRNKTKTKEWDDWYGINQDRQDKQLISEFRYMKLWHRFYTLIACFTYKSNSEIKVKQLCNKESTKDNADYNVKFPAD